MTRFIAAIVATIFSLASAVAEPVDAGHALVDIIAERTSAAPGETFYAALKLETEEGWHVYWRNPGDAGLPPTIAWSVQNGATLGAYVWPAPHELAVIPGELMDYGYNGTLVLPFPVTVSDAATGAVRLEGRADYLICKDVCIPETAPVELTLPLSGASVVDSSAGVEIAAAVAEAPAPFEGQAAITRTGGDWTLSLVSRQLTPDASYLRFFPFQHDIVDAAEQTVVFGSEGASIALTADPRPENPDGPISGVIIQETRGGVRTALEVTAEPGPPLAGTSGGRPASPKAAPLSASGFLAIAGLALLGGLVLNLMPCVLPVLSIKALGLVSAAASGQRAELRSHGVWYTAGVLVSFAALAAAIVAVRAATGTATLGFQLQYPPVVVILALIMFVIGLWLLGVVEVGGSLMGAGSELAAKQGSAGAFFTGVLAAIVGAPCVGPFLGVALGAVLTQPAVAVFAVFLAMGLGLALPFLVLSFAPGLQSLLPKPGAWMERLKQFFAFPMFLTAAWLLSVLGALSGFNAVAWTVAGAAAIAFGIWLLGAAGGGMKRPLQATGAAALLLGVAYPANIANGPAPAAGASTAYAAKYQTEAWSPDRVAALMADGRPIFVDFTATWCATCQLNKATTLRRETVQAVFQRNDVAFLVADYTRQDPVIAAELERRRRPGVPMYLYYAPGAPEPRILPEILSPDLVIGLVESTS